jgi:hypothetical protein
MSKSAPAVSLVMTVHQPDGRLLLLTEAQLPALAGRYAAVVAFCSQETQPAQLDALRRGGAAVHVDATASRGIEHVGAVRREAVRAGLLAGTSHLQLCDFDRALHWSAYHPAEMDEVAAAIPEHDLLVLGRTARAWATHPPYQAETEPLFNKVFALASGQAWDVGAGSRGLSRRAAGVVLAESRTNSVGTDAEWPLLLLARPGFCVGYRECEGLEFETADAFAPEIAAAGGYAAWEESMSADPRRWVFRLRIALLIAEAAAAQPLSGSSRGGNIE